MYDRDATSLSHLHHHYGSTDMKDGVASLALPVMHCSVFLLAFAHRGDTEMVTRSRVFAFAKGFYGKRKNCIRVARQAVEKSMQYQYRDRRQTKRDMRTLWVMRCDPAATLLFPTLWPRSTDYCVILAQCVRSRVHNVGTPAAPMLTLLVMVHTPQGERGEP